MLNVFRKSRRPRGSGNARGVEIPSSRDLWLAALAALSVAVLAPGCRSSQPRYDVRSAQPQKDVLVLTIELDERLTLEEYIDLARRETTKIRSTNATQEFPLYAVHVEFYLRQKRAGPRPPLAKVTWTASEAVASSGDTNWTDASPWARPPRVVLY